MHSARIIQNFYKHIERTGQQKLQQRETQCQQQQQQQRITYGTWFSDFDFTLLQSKLNVCTVINLEVQVFVQKQQLRCSRGFYGCREVQIRSPDVILVEFYMH